MFITATKHGVDRAMERICLNEHEAVRKIDIALKRGITTIHQEKENILKDRAVMQSLWLMIITAICSVIRVNA